MRLLNIQSLQFQEFFDTNIPRYAILSHRWGEDEVSYKQMRKGRAPNGPGLTKIHEFIHLAWEHKFLWVWIDTCCIDQRSSAELSEAINSMFQWYYDAEVCYAYLADVNSSSVRQEGRSFAAEFSASSWFRRGWTLQELLAPKKVLFYDATWTRIGDKDTHNELIERITGIDGYHLAKPDSFYRSSYPSWPSVAKIMSWAAIRETSRSEDIAYCLLGLFGINMPLLYGEGAEKAFIRLQIEIINKHEDESIFAWTADIQRASILAPHPKYFSNSAAIHPIPKDLGHPRYWITNRGLAMKVSPDAFLASGENEYEITIPLRCYNSMMNVWKPRTALTAEDAIKITIRSSPMSENTYFRARDRKRDLSSIDTGHLLHDPAETRILYFPLHHQPFILA
ncbi:MAG: hypothetical protein Q9218_005744 [Villophora microphyllina]